MSASRRSPNADSMRPAHRSGANVSAPAFRYCARCRGPFKPAKRWQVFCSTSCRRKAHEESKRTGVYYDIRSELAEIKAMLKEVLTLGVKP